MFWIFLIGSIGLGLSLIGFRATISFRQKNQNEIITRLNRLESIVSNTDELRSKFEASQVAITNLTSNIAVLCSKFPASQVADSKTLPEFLKELVVGTLAYMIMRRVIIFEYKNFVDSIFKCTEPTIPAMTARIVEVGNIQNIGKKGIQSLRSRLRATRATRK